MEQTTKPGKDTATLLAENRGIVIMHAKRAKAIFPYVPLSDLIAAGEDGLLRAARTWQPERGAKLATYAALWIRRKMRAAITFHRFPFGVSEMAAKGPLAAGMIRLDEPLNHGEGEPGKESSRLDYYASEPAATFNRDELASLESALEGLDERQRLVVERRYFEGRTQNEVAAEMGMTRQNVHLIEHAALKRLRFVLRFLRKEMN